MQNTLGAWPNGGCLVETINLLCLYSVLFGRLFYVESFGV